MSVSKRLQCGKITKSYVLLFACYYIILGAQYKSHVPSGDGVRRRTS